MSELELATIDDVLAELGAIIELTVEEDSPLGIFAYVYRRTTAKIAEGLDQGRFEDAGRMEQFDVCICPPLYLLNFQVLLDSPFAKKEELKNGFII
ncbi:MAG: DUF5995 family protein [Balneolaceae bacterium]|nr:DUF5995 family protein [Balneolaceae bacterium]